MFRRQQKTDSSGVASGSYSGGVGSYLGRESYAIICNTFLLCHRKSVRIEYQIRVQPPQTVLVCCFCFCFWRDSPQLARASSFTRFLDHTQRHITVGRTPLDEWSARLRDLYLKTHHTHNRQTCMPRVGFEPTISAGERPQTYVLDRAATGTVNPFSLQFIIHQSLALCSRNCWQRT